MSDCFLFQSSKVNFQILVFGITLQDARQYAKNTHPNYGMKFVSKNPTGINKYILCGTTEKQMELNRENLRKMLEEDN
jgi:hypothetical protein